MHQKIKDSTADIVVIDAALLIEAGWDTFVDQLWSTFVPREEAIRRVVNRDGLSNEEVLFILYIGNSLG